MEGECSGQSLASGHFSLLQGDPGFLALWIVLGLGWRPAWESMNPECGGMSGAAILLETHTHKNDACAFL